jgi:hypothetical protein
MRGFRTVALGAALLIGLLSTALAGNVKTDYDHKADFSGIHTYSWGAISSTDPFYAQRIRETVDKDLQGKGWQFLTSGGDVTIFAKGNVHNREELESYYNGFGGRGAHWGWSGWAGGDGTDTTSADASPTVGKLVIDVFDGNSRTLMWRGCAANDISSNSEKNTRELDQDLATMLKNIPPVVPDDKKQN